jgi:glycosyltransferase involved in cell wall biosynthesis
VGSAYSFLRYAFVHDDVILDTGWPMPRLETVVVPYGPHRFPDPTESRAKTRRELGIPMDALVLFSFGHIRDNKNLDYAVRALKEIPEAYLLVAGKRSAASQRPESYYREMAERLGVADRCRWVVAYVSEEEASNFFTASDLVLLTYSSSFRSASGVLHVAARYKKQSIVSAGQGSLQSVVRNYQIGLWVEPDDQNAVVLGIQEWMRNPPSPDWARYERENSWEENARKVVEALGR